MARPAFRAARTSKGSRWMSPQYAIPPVASKGVGGAATTALSVGARGRWRLTPGSPLASVRRLFPACLSTGAGQVRRCQQGAAS